MRTSFCIGSISVGVLSAAIGVNAQTAAKQRLSLAQLELTTEIAATTNEGYPAALRVTVRNVGGFAVSMPMLAGGCHPDNGVQIRSYWLREDERSGGGGGSGCGAGDQPTLWQRAKTQWVRLQPGEFMTTMLRVELQAKESGAVITY